MEVERLHALRSRISAEMQSTFACEFAGELSLTELLDLAHPIHGLEVVLLV